MFVQAIRGGDDHPEEMLGVRLSVSNSTYF